MNKEQLIKENAILKQNNQDLGEQNEKLNADMCRVLGFAFTEFEYGTRKEKLYIKSWAEIFAEIGKLIANQKRLDYITGFENLEVRMKEMEVNFQEFMSKREG